ncbi:hypothetical protein C2869_01025 [Saccharobesus litoralis]|uniref:DUF5050 domain-containing protein n=1 Tax=Saccharobesus litoralis TaxID=2172099 RepID=A0A2S0VLM6_9ALTE|nr:hypothetical protein [Saccharobesus litoralis]AWB65108.1 hypothetical protein C2869_01025 [Saccharobesus litoralis]
MLRLFLTLLIWLLSSLPAYAQQLEVIDINQSVDKFANSRPEHLVVFDNKLFFVADDGTHGKEIFTYDFATHDVSLVADIDPELYQDSHAENFTEYNGDLYFTACAGGIIGCELYKYDKQTAEVSLVVDVDPGFFSSHPNYLTVLNQTLYFTAEYGAYINENELYSFNASTGLTRRLTSFEYQGIKPNIQHLQSYDGKLYFQSSHGDVGKELYRYNPSNEQIELVKDINLNGDADVAYLTVYDGKLYFSATDGSNGYQLYEYTSNTNNVRQVTQLTGTDEDDFKTSLVHQGQLYFAANYRLYSYDATADQYQEVVDALDSERFSGPEYLISVGNKIYMESSGSIYSFDSVSKTVTHELTQTGNSSYISPRYLVEYNGNLYFQADDGFNGDELYSLDLANSEFKLAADLNPATDDSNPSLFVEYEGDVYFRGDTGQGRELLKYQVATESIVSVNDIADGVDISNPSNLLIYKNKLYFTASSNSDGFNLYRYDANTNAIEAIADIGFSPINYNNQDYFAVYDGDLYFTTSSDTTGYELYKYSEDNNLVELVSDIKQGSSSGFPKNYIVYQNKLYFSADDGQTGTELYVFDSTTGNSELVYDLNDGGLLADDSNPANFTIYKNKLYFSAKIGGYYSSRKLHVYDGTTNVIDAVINQTTDLEIINPTDLVVYNDKLYMSTNTLSYYDAETGSVTNIAETDRPTDLTVFKDKLYFSSDYQFDYGQELYVYDVNSQLATLVEDIYLGIEDADPEYLFATNNRLFFSATSQALGEELYILGSNIPASGTVNIKVSNGVNYTLTAIANIEDKNGLGDFDVQWQLDGQSIPGQTSASLLVENSFATGVLSAVISFTDGEGNLESVHSAPFIIGDFDNDGLNDFVDTDDDQDGIEDSFDTDHDNDNVLNNEDAFPLDASETSDADGDGIGDNQDTNTYLSVLSQTVTNQQFTIESTGSSTDVRPFLENLLEQVGGDLTLVDVISGNTMNAGIHQIKFIISNHLDNQQTLALSARINPQVWIPDNKSILSGEPLVIPIVLFGDPVEYPVTLQFSIPDGFEAESDLVLITEGQTAGQLVLTPKDLSGEFSLELLSADNADLNEFMTTQITVIADLPPRLSAQFISGGHPITVIGSNVDDIQLNVFLQNETNEHQLEVFVDGQSIGVYDANTLAQQITLNTSQASDGKKQVIVEVTELNQNNNLTAQIELSFYVNSSINLTEQLDSDNDGISDHEEGTKDSDLDGIPDYLDSSNNSAVKMPFDSGELISLSGNLTIGETRLAIDNGLSSGVAISIAEFEQYTGELIANDDEVEFISPIIDFKATNVSGYAEVVVMLPNFASDELTRYRKLNSENKWQDFIIDNNNYLSSAFSQSGSCPTSNQDYQKGITAGADCIAIRISDGGPNDADGSENGVVVDPGVFVKLPEPVTTPVQPPVTTPDVTEPEPTKPDEGSPDQSQQPTNGSNTDNEGSSGGSIGYLVLACLLLLFLRMSAKRQPR